MTKKEQLKILESDYDFYTGEIQKRKNEVKEINQKIEKAEEEKEIQESRIAYYDLLIREEIEKFGAEGEAILREMFPEEADEILQKR